MKRKNTIAYAISFLLLLFISSGAKAQTTIIGYSQQFTFNTTAALSIESYSDLFLFNTMMSDYDEIVAYSDMFTFNTQTSHNIVGFSDLFGFNTLTVNEIVGVSNLFVFNTTAAEEIIGFSGLFEFNTITDIPTFSLSFIVTDSFGDPVDDAIITLNETENDAGDYLFEDIAAGTYTYTISRVCHNDLTDQINVQSDMEISVMMEFDILLGDANGDGIVNVLDIIAIGNYYSGIPQQTFCFQNADVNNDNIINIIDIIATINIFTGKSIAPYSGLVSEKAFIFMADDAIILESDGTLAGIQFEVFSINQNIEIVNELKGFELMYTYKNGMIKAIMFNLDNTPIPEGEVKLVSFKPKNYFAWNDVKAGNLNAEEVDVTIVVQEDVTSITDIQNTFFVVYPNPTQDNLFIDFNKSFNSGEISLINSNGQTVKNLSVNKNTKSVMKLEVGELPLGVYILRVKLDEYIMTKRIMIQ